MEKRIIGGRKEGREEGIGMGQMLQSVREGDSVQGLNGQMYSRKGVCLCYGSVRGRGGSNGEDIVEERKACGLIDGSSMHSACLFIIIFLLFFLVLVFLLFDVAYPMPCVQSSCFRSPPARMCVIVVFIAFLTSTRHAPVIVSRGMLLVLLRGHGLGSGLFTSMFAFNLPPSE